jgi:hypothetical protein
MPFHLIEPTANLRKGYPFSGKTARQGQLAWQVPMAGACMAYIFAKKRASSSVATCFILGSEWGEDAGDNESELVCGTEDRELIEFFQDCSLRAGKPTV